MSGWCGTTSWPNGFATTPLRNGPISSGFSGRDDPTAGCDGQPSFLRRRPTSSAKERIWRFPLLTVYVRKGYGVFLCLSSAAPGSHQLFPRRQRVAEWIGRVDAENLQRVRLAEERQFFERHLEPGIVGVSFDVGIELGRRKCALQHVA